MLKSMVSRSLVLAYDRQAVPLGELLDRKVTVLREAHRAGDPVAVSVLRGTGTDRSGDEENPTSPLTSQDVQLAVAREHGYADWAAARAHADVIVDARFEAAADAVHWGELTVLRDLLDAHPPLISMRSPFPHHCTLLHYVAANGIEVERQLQSPPNAAEVMRLLLKRGAEPDATCDLYGGGSGMTTLCLLVSSCVPFEAGVQAPLVEVLCGGGAAANGPDDDGLPLQTAISFGYTQAAEALARCGARVDNLVFYAALGDLAGVRGCFGDDGRLAPGRAADDAARARVPEENLLEYALGSAALHGRREVVEFLLGKGPDLSFAEPSFGATAQGAARYNGHTEIAELIEAWPAPPPSGLPGRMPPPSRRPG
jgi:ankyrin repeat protein